MSFTVAPNGRAVDVKSEDVKSGDDRAADELLRHCLTDVISRAPFRPFDGPAIAIVDYPVEIR